MKLFIFGVFDPFRKASFNKSVRKAGKAASGAINVCARIAFFEAGMITPARSDLT
jgi:hypothetical protein